MKSIYDTQEIHPGTSFVASQIIPSTKVQWIEEVFPGMGLCFHGYQTSQGNLELALLTFRNEKHEFLWNNLFSMGFCPLKNLTNFFYLGLYDNGDLYYVKSEKKFYWLYDGNYSKNKSLPEDSTSCPEWFLVAKQRKQILIDDAIALVWNEYEIKANVELYFSVNAGITEDLTDKL